MNCASHGCPSAWESDLDFVFPPAMQGFRRQVLPVSTGGDVCRVLKRWSDGWMRPPVRAPYKRAVVNVLLPQFSEFISQTLLEEGELCLRILAKLDALVHCTDDVCVAQELVRHKLPRTQRFWPSSGRRQFSTQAVLHPGRSRC